MSELAIRDEQPVTTEVARSAAVQRLADWAHSAQAAHEVAVSLVQTSFVPEGFRGKPHEATAAILAGSEVGLSPMAALRSFDVIQGTAAPRAITLRAVAQAAGHELVLRESTATRCVMDARRRGTSDWQRVVWTIERARQLGLTNKPNWRNQAQAMLVARATGEAARLVAADAILGLNGGYASEELNDGDAVSDAPEAPPVTMTVRKAQRKPVGPPPVDEPELDDATLPPAVELAEPESITSAQTKKMAAMMREADITERQDALDYVMTVIDRQITSRSELTKDEASRVIDALGNLAAAKTMNKGDGYDDAAWSAGGSADA